MSFSFSFFHFVLPVYSPSLHFSHLCLQNAASPLCKFFKLNSLTLNKKLEKKTGLKLGFKTWLHGINFTIII